jgi:hypothetical protein
LSQAIARMKALLFRKPFVIEMWFVLGLSAWLADILSGGAGGGGARSGWKGSRHELAGAADKVGAWLANPTVLMIIAAVLMVFALALLAIAWVSARANFVFLDNVVRGRAAFVEPWKRLGRLGTSLFLWNAALSFAWLVPIGAIAWPFRRSLVSLVTHHEFVMPGIGGIVLGSALAAVAMLAIAVIATLMNAFVVPLMYRYDETAWQAWARFWPLISSRAGDFGAFVAFEWIVWVGVVLALMIAGLLTCCVGLFLMAIPYVGSVLLLPVTVSARAFGPEFLRQFGPEWDVFEDAGAAAVAAPGMGEATNVE